MAAVHPPGSAMIGDDDYDTASPSRCERRRPRPTTRTSSPGASAIIQVFFRLGVGTLTVTGISLGTEDFSPMCATCTEKREKALVLVEIAR